MVAGWIFGGVGCHATSKAADLSYRLGYLITAVLYHLVCPVCPLLSCCKENVYVAVTAAPVTDRAVYHAIGDRFIRGVAVTAATDAARAGYHLCNSCFGVDMVGSTHSGRGVDVWRCWVPYNK